MVMGWGEGGDGLRLTLCDWDGRGRGRGACFLGGEVVSWTEGERCVWLREGCFFWRKGDAGCGLCGGWLGRMAFWKLVGLLLCLLGVEILAEL